ncbi:MAG: hypothetical protein OXH09_11240 [Gammaproteobacteria bacterium]|nr:hypothetical protein [Gammaproteobacteria bacterium]
MNTKDAGASFSCNFTDTIVDTETGNLGDEQVDWADGEAVPKPGVNADVKPLSLADMARGAG